MQNYSDFEAYFEQLVINDPDLQHAVFVMDWNEILELQLEPNLYPALVIEIPDIGLSDNGGTRTSYESAFSIIKGMPQGETRQLYRDALNDNLVIAKRVHQQIFCDSEQNDLFDADLEDKLNPLTKVTTDNCYGWRGRFIISSYE